MKRKVLYLFAVSLLLFSSCSASRIAAEEETATQAWNDLLSSYRDEATAARAVVERLRVIAPAEHLVAATIEQAAREMEQGCRQANPHDSRTVQTLDRWHRVLEVQHRSLAKRTYEYREMGEDAILSGTIRRFEEARETTAASRDRYHAAALAYNRALRTFPESVLNNMFLKKKSLVLLSSDRNTNSGAGAR